MNILVVNDDGFYSDHSMRMVDHLDSNGATTIYCAPDKDRSGCGSSASIGKCISLQKNERGYLVKGTPIDAVICGLALAEERSMGIDWVISGPNYGLNYGYAHYYSGTVSASREAHRRGKKTLAISVSPNVTSIGDLAKKIWVLMNILERDNSDLMLDVYLNMNINNMNNTRILFDNEQSYYSYGLEGKLVNAEVGETTKTLKLVFPSYRDIDAGMIIGIMTKRGAMDCKSQTFNTIKKIIIKNIYSCF